ncbi:unnamed protein product, partial [Mesorhabditis belari]|uniref:Kinase n=1 Tax=Mesorhabditis belari TaxID=2138241 RepID=A0AAF3F3K6_9BILA
MLAEYPHRRQEMARPLALTVCATDGEVGKEKIGQIIRRDQTFDLTPTFYELISQRQFQKRKCFAEKRSFSCTTDVSVETMAITALPRESIDNWLKERLKKWVQLSGHEGSIVPASSHTLYKKQCSNRAEGTAYEAISKDPKLVCIGFTPRFYKQIEKNEESFIEIEDLLAQFADPSHTGIMDIKVGTRTFLESEVSNAKLRADLYDKMISIDPDEPTEEEHKRKSITKLRYMQFRERESSSAELGFRIEAAKMPGGCLQKNFQKVRSFDDIEATLRAFFGPDLRRVRNAILGRLIKMRDAVENSDFFATHEVVGSSLLLMYDQDKVGVWAIDFAKSTKIEPGRVLTHRKTWTPGNNEDGYLMGLDNLIQIVEDIHVENGQKR